MLGENVVRKTHYKWHSRRQAEDKRNQLKWKKRVEMIKATALPKNN